MGCVSGANLQRDKIKTNPYSQARVLDLKHILTWFLVFGLLCRHTASPRITARTHSTGTTLVNQKKRKKLRPSSSSSSGFDDPT